MRAWLIASLVAAPALGLGFFACHDTNECDFGHCGGGPGSDAGPDVKLPPDCPDLLKDPSEQPGCVHNDVGIFVAPTTAGGSDDNAGTKESPVATLSKALDRAVLKSRIYVCSGDYVEAKTVAVTRAISIYGGFSCPQWEVGKGQGPANISLKDPGVVLSVSNVSQAVTLADLSVTAKNAVSAGTSSIAGWIANSSGGVTLKRVTVAAGIGAGSEASTPPPLGDYDGGATPGSPATSGSPGGAATNRCGDDTSVGGAGGEKADSGTTGKNGDDGTPKITPSIPSPDNSGTGGKGDQGCGGPGIGQPGSYGAGGQPAAEGSALPAVSATAIVVRNGAGGGNGGTAQGGGGGAGKAGHGGGGGAGGCGGKGGSGGQAGGSSIALLVFNTKVRLLESNLVAAAGGQGGPAGQGQAGQRAGAEGSSGGLGGCGGGAGGLGGSGAGGNGGPGGASIALAYFGDVPNVGGADVPSADTLDGMTTPAPASAAQGGAGGLKRDGVPPDGREGKAGNKGPTGVVKAVVALPAQ